MIPGAAGLTWSRGMVRVTAQNAVATLTLDRPEKLNAMERAFWPDLRAALEVIAEAESVRAIVLTGAGDRAFSVGGDVASFAALRSDEERHHFQIDAMRTFAAVQTNAIPIIAAIRGFAMGGGCEIAMACSFVLASRSARFAMPEARFGLVPGYGAIRAPGIIGAQMTRMMIYAGEQLSAEDALRVGLVQKLCDDATLAAEAMRVAERVASAPATTIAAARHLIGDPLDEEAVARSIETIARLHGTPESRAAVATYLDRSREKEGEQ